MLDMADSSEGERLVHLGEYAVSPPGPLSQHVSHAVFFGVEVATVVVAGAHDDGDAAGDLDAVAFETDDLLGIVGEEADAVGF
jgi:hypothetical protein